MRISGSRCGRLRRRQEDILRAADIDARTANAYAPLLRSLYPLDLVPAWAVNRLNRLARTTKHFLVDASLVTASLGLSVDGLMRDRDMLERALETFVAARLRLPLSRPFVRVRRHGRRGGCRRDRRRALQDRERFPALLGFPAPHRPLSMTKA